jgi:hypothetical protein
MQRADSPELLQSCPFKYREEELDRIYRLSKAAALLHRLEEILIPPVPASAWGSCSWVGHFRGEGPRVIQLPVLPGHRGGTAGR